MTAQRKFASVYDLAQRYDCHPSSVWRWVAQGKFPHPVKIGGMTRWLESEVSEHEAKAAAEREAA